DAAPPAHGGSRYRPCPLARLLVVDPLDGAADERCRLCAFPPQAVDFCLHRPQVDAFPLLVSRPPTPVTHVLGDHLTAYAASPGRGARISHPSNAVALGAPTYPGEAAEPRFCLAHC